MKTTTGEMCQSISLDVHKLRGVRELLTPFTRPKTSRPDWSDIANCGSALRYPPKRPASVGAKVAIRVHRDVSGALQ